MKILYIIPTLSFSAGGPSRCAIGLAEAMARRGIDVTVAAGVARGSPEVVISGVKMVTGRLLPFGVGVPSPNLMATLWKEIRQADIVHLHSIWNGIATFSAWCARIANKPLVSTPHGMLDRFNMSRRKLFKQAYFNFFESSNLSKVAGFHFLDETERAGCDWLPNLYGRLSVIEPNGLDLVSVQAALSRCAERTPFAGGKAARSVNLVYLGRLNPIKGLDLQIEVLSTLRSWSVDARLHLIGPDDGEGARLDRLAAKMGVAPWFHRHGPIYDGERLMWLRDANAVLLTSYYECNSVAAAEVMAVGGILVGADTCHLGAAAKAGAALVVGRDARAIAKTIVDLEDNPLAGAEIRSRAISYAGKRLAWNGIAANIAAFYATVFNESVERARLRRE